MDFKSWQCCIGLKWLFLIWWFLSLSPSMIEIGRINFPNFKRNWVQWKFTLRLAVKTFLYFSLHHSIFHSAIRQVSVISSPMKPWKIQPVPFWGLLIPSNIQLLQTKPSIFDDFSVRNFHEKLGTIQSHRIHGAGIFTYIGIIWKITYRGQCISFKKLEKILVIYLHWDYLIVNIPAPWIQREPTWYVLSVLIWFLVIFWWFLMIFGTIQWDSTLLVSPEAGAWSMALLLLSALEKLPPALAPRWDAVHFGLRIACEARPMGSDPMAIPLFDVEYPWRSIISDFLLIPFADFNGWYTQSPHGKWCVYIYIYVYYHTYVCLYVWNGVEWSGVEWSGMECMYVCMCIPTKSTGDFFQPTC